MPSEDGERVAAIASEVSPLLANANNDTDDVPLAEELSTSKLIVVLLSIWVGSTAEQIRSIFPLTRARTDWCFPLLPRHHRDQYPPRTNQQ